MNENKNYGNLLSLMVKSFLLAIFGIVFPVIYIFFPAMYISESLKEGIFKIMGIFLAVCLLIGAIFNPLNGLIVFAIFGPLILIFHYMISTKKSWQMTLLAGAISFFISIIVLILSFGINGEVINSPDTIKGITEVYNNIGQEVGLSDSEIFSLTNRISQMYKAFLQMAPSYLMVFSLVFSYIIYISVTRTMFARGRIIFGPPPLEFVKIPREFILFVGLSIFVLYLFNGSGDYYVFNKNLMFIFFFALFIEGFALVKFFMARFGLNTFLQTIIFIIALTIPYIQLIFIFLGFMDMFINLRKFGV
nr:DUF2232 domain-containing protein [Peptoniphilus raoultii]